MYITINGVDGAGKDSQMDLLKGVFPESIFIFEPGGTKDTNIIRLALLDKDLTNEERINILENVLLDGELENYAKDCVIKAIEELSENGLTGAYEMYLYAAARCENIEKIVKPNRDEKHILGNRSVACSMAYQGAARNIGFDKVWEVNAPALNNEYPDLEIFLDLPIEVARERLKKRTDKVERFDEEGEQFFNVVRNGYLKFYEEHCPFPYVIVNGNDTVENIHNLILKIVQKHMA